MSTQKEAAEAENAGRGETRPGLDFVFDVPLRLRVELGQTKLLVRDVVKLKSGSVVELDRQDGEPADVFVNDRLIARAELTQRDGRLAVRIVEVVAPDAVEAPGD